VVLLVIDDHALPPELFAAATVRLWRKNRFPPTISELSDECDYARRAATNAWRVVTKVLALLDNAEEAIIATEDLDGARK